MSFNRRGGERRPDRPERFDRDRGERPSYPPRGGDRPPYQQRSGGGDRPPYQQRSGGGDRPPFQPRGGGDRPPYQSRPRFNPEDEGGMQIRLDPRRLSALKRLAGEAGMRPGELARQWVEERIDAARTGSDRSLGEQLADLVARIEALEGGRPAPVSQLQSAPEPEPEPQADTAEAPEEPMQEAQAPEATDAEPVAEPPRKRARRNAVAAAPSERVALHEEMIEVLRERGPMSAGELAAAIVERGRYAPPRSGKLLDAAMVSQRVSNPTYRSRFTRQDGKIGLPETE